MSFLKALVFSALVCVTWGIEMTFPDGFMFGAGTSSYQIEGGWNASDKGESIWDHFTHTKPEAIADRSNGDAACDSYNLWERDVEMISQLGLDSYRFSISWPRLLPSGFPNHTSLDGAQYYSDLIDELLDHGIEPIVTLYHWELPQRLQNLGGWTNPLIADWFADYARVVFSLYGDRVKYWLTINEPIVVCEYPYNTGLLAPGIIDPGVGNLLCNKHVLLAHAKAYRVYDEEFRHKHNGLVSLANHLLWLEPATKAEEKVTELARQLMGGMYSHAIYSKQGGWPRAIEQIIAANSKREGYPRSRLPKFTQEEIELCRGTYDYYGMNHYTSRKVRFPKKGEVPGWWFVFGSTELNIVLEVDPTWDDVQITMASYPPGIRRQMAWLKKEYGDIDILITENGYSADVAGLDDKKRVNYLKEYLEQVLLSIYVDGVSVIGHTAWSLMDNFEWADGYNTKFGLYRVDFESPEKTRTLRSSGKYYASVAYNRSLNVSSKYLTKKFDIHNSI